MDGSVVDAVFAAHYARLGGGALQDEDFDSDDDLDDLDELIDACVAEECAAAYASPISRPGMQTLSAAGAPALP